MAKFYLNCGDLKKIVSTSDDPKTTCKRELDKFLVDNKNSKDKSVSTIISVSELGFRDHTKNYKNDQTIYFDVAEILDLIN